MKQLTKIFFASLLIFMPLLHSCDAMLDVESERYTFEQNARMSSIHDTLYSMVGVLSKMQALGDRYVLLGELRGDLMDISENATTEMQDIYNFDVSKDNSYASMNAFYGVINQCNYIIQYSDTAYERKSDKPYIRVYTAAKAIRAWTYMQMMQNFNTVPYSGESVISIQDTQKDFPVFDRATMIDTLIADLLPLVEVDNMDMGFFGSYNSKYSIFPVSLLLGDLYLLKDDFANAAAMYYKVIYERGLNVQGQYKNEWNVQNDVIIDGVSTSWYNALRPVSGEVVNVLATYPKYGNTFSLDSMSSQKQIIASGVAIQKWLDATYFENESSTKKGDLRILHSISTSFGQSLLMDDVANQYESSGIKLYPTISKYSNMNYTSTEDDANILTLYRTPLIYLRFAEAINRLGYPMTAFSVMKYGLNSTTLAKPEIVREWNRVDTAYTPSFLSSFVFARFDNNVGTRQRGCGNVQNDKNIFIIPDSVDMVVKGYCSLSNVPTKDDTIQYVEDMILEECALETAFEGNRYLDLMRIALRRNDPAYLANKVAAKYVNADRREAIRAKLMNESNWYLPQ